MAMDVFMIEQPLPFIGVEGGSLAMEHHRVADCGGDTADLFQDFVRFATAHQ